MADALFALMMENRGDLERLEIQIPEHIELVDIPVSRPHLPQAFEFMIETVDITGELDGGSKRSYGLFVFLVSPLVLGEHIEIMNPEGDSAVGRLRGLAGRPCEFECLCIEILRRHHITSVPMEDAELHQEGQFIAGGHAGIALKKVLQECCRFREIALGPR